jgi:hypothetical protein
MSGSDSSPDSTGSRGVLPDWISSLSELGRDASDNGLVAAVGSRAAEFVVTPLLRSFFGVVSALIGGILLLFRGSEPGFSPSEETLGIADVGPLVVSLVGTPLSSVLTDVIGLPASLLPSGSTGPIESVAITIVFVAVVVGVVRVGRDLAAGLPLIGGFLK